MNKQDIVNEMQVCPAIDPELEIKRRVEFIQNQLVSADSKTLVLGISGGVDSATCGRLAQLAVDGLNEKYNCADYRFAAVRLPYGTQKDEEDAQKSLEFIKPSLNLAVILKTESTQLIRVYAIRCRIIIYFLAMMLLILPRAI